MLSKLTIFLTGFAQLIADADAGTAFAVNLMPYTWTINTYCKDTFEFGSFSLRHVYFFSSAPTAIRISRSISSSISRDYLAGDAASCLNTPLSNYYHSLLPIVRGKLRASFA